MRLVIQIDGGYLRSVAQSLRLKYDNDFIEKVARLLVFPDSDNLLRIMYYDAPGFVGERPLPVSRKPHPFNSDSVWLEELAAREYFAVRRGTLKWRGWKLKSPETLSGTPSDEDYKPDFQQKGVDLRIGVDMVTFAYERTAERVMLIAGDTDFIPAMKIARRRGLQVIGVDLPGQRLSREFRQHIDIIRELSHEALRQP
jgi:uncharacterized LabA/DUF88 family protein